jgi:segregation and condensation protein B
MVPVELSAASLRTLSAIALHGPMKQSSLIEVRGANAYDHVKELLKYQLISKRRKDKDRSFTLNVTPKFYEYFKLAGDKNELKARLAQMVTVEEAIEASPN